LIEAHRAAIDTERSGDYADVRCQVFTPDSFMRNMKAVQEMQLTGFSVRKLFEPEPDGYESIGSLQKQN
jgi:hypothetical protein